MLRFSSCSTRILLAAALAAAVIGAWFLDLDAQRFTEALAVPLRAPVTGPLLMVGVYVVAGIVVCLLAVLIAATAMLYDPLPAFLTSMAGALVSASLLFWAARFLGRETVDRRAGDAFRRIDRALARQGAVVIAFLRAVPVSPFTVTCVAAGISRIRYVDYVAGTITGLIPVMVAYGVIGREAGRILVDPTATDVALLAATVLTATGFGWAVGCVFRRLRPEVSDERG